MGPRQRVEMKRSRLRERMGELLGKEGRTDAETAELSAAEGALTASEVELRAAIALEESEREAVRPPEPVPATPEEREFAALERRASIVPFVVKTLTGASDVPEGAERELRQALGVSDAGFPTRLLAPPPPLETRATTDIDTATGSATWLDRLFARTAAMDVGVTFRGVPAGQHAMPVLTAGATGAQRGRGEAAADAAWTAGVTVLEPARAAARAVFSSTDAHRLPGLEDALVRDLRAALLDSIDKAVFVGDASANEARADVSGLQSVSSVVEKELTQTQKTSAGDVLAAFSELIDGLHASAVSDLRIVLAVGADQLWRATVLSVSSESASVFKTMRQFLGENGVTWRSRAGLESTTTAGKIAGFVGRANGIEGAAVAGIWEESEMIRDHFSDSGKGDVSLTLQGFWQLGVPRPTNFARIKFVT